MESAAKRHSKVAPASVEKVVVVETEEIHESRRYDVRTAALVVIAILLSLFALRVGAAFFIPLFHQNMSRDRAAAVASASRRPAPCGPSRAFSASRPMAGILALFFATKLDWSFRKLREAA